MVAAPKKFSAQDVCNIMMKMGYRRYCDDIIEAEINGRLLTEMSYDEMIEFGFEEAHAEYLEDEFDRLKDLIELPDCPFKQLLFKVRNVGTQFRLRH